MVLMEDEKPIDGCYHARENLLHQTLCIGHLPQVQLRAAKMGLQTTRVLDFRDLLV
jgi:hypothetical protein